MSDTENKQPSDDSHWEHRSDQRFVDYYAEASQSPETMARFGSVMEKLLAILGPERATETLSVADVGCGAGVQAMMWAGKGHDVHGLDVNSGLIELATSRAAGADLNVDFRVGTATDLPWSDASMDICLLPEL
ncbi:MAG: class I SAM-dependent methyltransferase, partial [Gammaproteobacteria bacterium]